MYGDDTIKIAVLLHKAHEESRSPHAFFVGQILRRQRYNTQLIWGNVCREICLINYSNSKKILVVLCHKAIFLL